MNFNNRSFALVALHLANSTAFPESDEHHVGSGTFSCREEKTLRLSERNYLQE